MKALEGAGLKLYPWNTIDEAAKWLTTELSESFSEKDILILGANAELKLNATIPTGCFAMHFESNHSGDISISEKPIAEQFLPLTKQQCEQIAGYFPLYGYEISIEIPSPALDDFKLKFGTVIPIDTNAVTLTSHESIRVSREDLLHYAKVHSVLDADASPLPAEMPPNDVIPGKLPRTGCGKLAIKAALRPTVPCPISAKNKITGRTPPILTAEINAASEAALEPSDPSSVWAELTKMAGCRTGCLLGIDGKDIKYQDGEEVKFFKKRSLNERMRRASTRDDVQ